MIKCRDKVNSSLERRFTIMLKKRRLNMRRHMMKRQEEDRPKLSE